MKKIFGMISIILLTAILTGSGIYLWQKERCAKGADSAQKQIAEPKKALPTQEKNVQKDPVAPAENTTIEKISASKPVIVFKPATFTEQEKEDLLTRIINPYIDYALESESTTPLSISIVKNTEGQNTTGYMYTIDVIFGNDTYSDWLEREVGTPLRTWTPDCMDTCTFSEQYKMKHPNVVAEYNKNK
ncbi:MAG: hypothetical protein WC819_04685 [Parcubacteria group bacterium]|jgi:hypothetical protein